MVITWKTGLVISSANISTISLTVARAMKPTSRSTTLLNTVSPDTVQRVMSAGPTSELGSREDIVLIEDGAHSPPPRADWLYGSARPSV